MEKDIEYHEKQMQMAESGIQEPEEQPKKKGITERFREKMT